MSHSAIAIPLPEARVNTRPLFPAFVFAAGDALALILSVVMAVCAKAVLGGLIVPQTYVQVLPMIGLFFAVYYLLGLYPGIMINPVMEIRKLSLATSMVFILMGTLLFLSREHLRYSRWVFAVAWLIALAAVPLTRALVRHTFSRFPWWGYPVAVFRSGELGARVLSELIAKPVLGLRPVVIVDPDMNPAPDKKVPVYGDLQSAWPAIVGLQAHRAVAAMSHAQYSDILRFVDTHAGFFSHVYLVPDLTGVSSIGIAASDVSDTLTLEIRQSLMLPGSRLAKRLMDQGLGLLIMLAALPAMIAVAVLVKLTSPGPIFYAQRRIGQRGEEFKMWKFRSMRTNGDQILAQHLEANPEAAAEWAANRKLKNDPRVTPIGALIRRTSLDELPQLWNVLKGEMSLVGPRPIVQAEVSHYGQYFDLYTRVTPGLTGLWQVSGRSLTTYERRVDLDSYYVRNWSPWLDVYVLARTVRVVLAKDGAY